MASQKKLLLVVMDGVGSRADSFGNAVKMAYTPNLNFLKENCFYTELKAHGTAVGLPSEDDMGNSEVGHNAMGAGRVFAQGASLVKEAVLQGALFSEKIWTELMGELKSSQKTLHLLGLLSDGNVHSHEDHLHRLIKEAAKSGVKRIRVHALLDGRDVSAQSAEIYLERVEKIFLEVRETCDAQVASAGGRMKVTMDRYNANWEMVRLGWETHVGAKGPVFNSPLEGLDFYRKENPQIVDQDIPPYVIRDQKTNRPEPIRDEDSLILFNFRGDRSIAISRAFEEENFSEFKREPNPRVQFFGMTQYDGDLKIPKKFLVTPPLIDNTLGEYLCHLGLKQFACSETQKYGHVTYFWNGNRSGYFDQSLEVYKEIPSDLLSFDEKPWMKAYEICEETIKAMKAMSFDFGRINFPNGDMVGHTGDLAASVSAVATVDLMIGKLIKAATASGYSLIVTADHGNCEEMFDLKAGENFSPKALKPKTSHTKSPVPFSVFDPNFDTKKFKNLAKDPTLAHIANTVLCLLGEKPRECYFESILQVK